LVSRGGDLVEVAGDDECLDDYMDGLYLFGAPLFSNPEVAYKFRDEDLRLTKSIVRHNRIGRKGASA
jgi:hypothetical protein